MFDNFCVAFCVLLLVWFVGWELVRNYFLDWW
jgi:hypothetical protein